ncbi:MAG: GNAT family N-acetyltransferase [Gammaproteobacteria bacterium]|nr:GNAT family N-acetyltransferase [Gammaproteobacteria bacterium]
MPEVNTPITTWFEQLLQRLSHSQQRRLVSCQGSQYWCDQILKSIMLQTVELLVLSSRNLVADAVAFSKSETLPGREFEVVVVDLFGGLNADVIAIAGGLVKSGGLLILLSEKPSRWHEIEDHYAIWQNESVSDKHLFIEYFFNRMEAKPQAVTEICEGLPLPAIVDSTAAILTPVIDGKTDEQRQVIHQIKHWLTYSRQKIALIVASRGRGKSVCLGLIAGELINSQHLSVCITAYSRQSATMLLAQLESAVFVSPDRLIENPQKADLLLVDEAAMLPYPVLTELCKHYRHVIMATTTGGYEGTGQGFQLRFLARLPDYLHLEIDAPVRWAANDILESWLDDTLQLLPVLGQSESIEPSQCHYRVLDRQQSQQDIDLLLRVYALIVSAHYRTRPSDLRALMENPDLLLVVAEYNDELYGVAVLNREGGLDESLCQKVFLGERRPRGHLLAQMLTAQAGVKNFAKFNGLRIQRIAVREEMRRQGVGRGMIQAAEAYAGDNGFDYIGASFAFDSESAKFWQSGNFQLVHISYGQGKSSGNHSVAVIKSMNADVKEIIEKLLDRIQTSLSLWLCQYLQYMDADSIIALLRYSHYSTELSVLEIDEIHAFSAGHKGLELCFVGLQKFVMSTVAAMPEECNIHPWLVEKLIQNKAWRQLGNDASNIGRKAKQNLLRKLVGEMSDTNINFQKLVDFWFSDEVSQYWFNSKPEFDQQLTNSYAALWQRARAGTLDTWRENATGCLALVILFDQLPLNMFRGKAESFATEALSREVAQAAIDKGFDLDLPIRYKAFLYMPFMHSEDLDDQAKSLRLFDQPGLEDNFRFAKHHYSIVERFGRFPHRNAILGRRSSKAEIDYLNSREAFQG